MASPSVRTAGVPPPVAAGATVDTAHLDRLVEKGLTAGKSSRYALAAAFFRRAADEALRLHGEIFVCAYLTARRASSLVLQSQLVGATTDERAALFDEAWMLLSISLPFIVRRMDDNTMLPGRGTAVEVAFYKRFTTTERATVDAPPLSARNLQLVGLSLGYATAVLVADQLLRELVFRQDVIRDVEAQAFVLRMVDCM